MIDRLKVWLLMALGLLMMVLGLTFLTPASPAHAEAVNSCYGTITATGQTSAVCVRITPMSPDYIGSLVMTCSNAGKLKADPQVNGTSIEITSPVNGQQVYTGGGAKADINSGCSRTLSLAIYPSAFTGNCFYVNWVGDVRFKDGSLGHFNIHSLQGTMVIGGVCVTPH